MLGVVVVDELNLLVLGVLEVDVQVVLVEVGVEDEGTDVGLGLGLADSCIERRAARLPQGTLCSLKAAS